MYHMTTKLNRDHEKIHSCTQTTCLFALDSGHACVEVASLDTSEKSGMYQHAVSSKNHLAGGGGWYVWYNYSQIVVYAIYGILYFQNLCWHVYDAIYKHGHTA